MSSKRIPAFGQGIASPSRHQIRRRATHSHLQLAHGSSHHHPRPAQQPSAALMTIDEDSCALSPLLMARRALLASCAVGWLSAVGGSGGAARADSGGGLAARVALPLNQAQLRSPGSSLFSRPGTILYPRCALGSGEACSTLTHHLHV
jgi:hypothetical protein